MIKALKTLIKLHKNKLDKISKDIEFNEIEKLRLIEKKALVEEEMSREIETYSATEFSFMLDTYLEHTRKLLKRLEAQVNQVEAIIARLRIQLKEQFSELKKYEIAYSNRKAIEDEKIKKYEAKQLDEFNINKFANEGK